MIRVIVTVFMICMAFCSNAWNAMGHQLVAQIAYDHLTPEARKLFNQYNRSYNTVSPTKNFITASTWLDSIRSQDIHWFDLLHYIDIPFSRDETPLPSKDKQNALLGIKHARAVLSSSKSSRADKGLSLRILIHVIGDIHQPLHTATEISKKYPQGDLGGNLFFLGKNSIGENLHQYWDRGGGILLGKSQSKQVKHTAKLLEKKWSCKQAMLQKKPSQWINSSHNIALNQVYTIAPNTIPDQSYQLNTQNITQKQIHKAGCRLAFVLNQIAAAQG
jgi:hypothetical protein